MPQEISTQAAGLFTNPNQLNAPQGALDQASDIVISRRGLMEQRRGFDGVAISGALPAGTGSLERLIRRDSDVPALLALDLSGNYGWLSSSGLFTVITSSVVPFDFLHSAETDGNLYLTTEHGVLRHSGQSPTGTIPSMAGVPPGMIGSIEATGSTSGTIVGTAIASDSQVAYRVVWLDEDASKGSHIGAPSGRSIVVNPAGVSTFGMISGTASFRFDDYPTNSPGITANSGSLTVQADDTESWLPAGNYRISSSSVAGTVLTLYSAAPGLTATISSDLKHRIGISARDAIVSVIFPTDVTSSAFFQVHRSPSSAQADIEPSDECALVHESDTWEFFKRQATLTGAALQFVTATLPRPHGLLVGDSVSITPDGTYVVTGSVGNQFNSGTFQVIKVPTSSSLVYLQGFQVGIGMSMVSASLTPKIVRVVDTVPDAILGASLYTDPSQEGILASADMPPAAGDLALFGESLFYGNTVGRDILSTQLLTVPDFSNVSEFGGLIVFLKKFISGSLVATEEYTFRFDDPATMVPSGNYRDFYDLPITQQIELAAMFIVDQVNTSSRRFRAYYTSNSDEQPGAMSFETIGIDRGTGDYFTFDFQKDLEGVRTVDNSFIPVAATSSRDEWRNGLFYSKSQELEAVPRTNFFRIGENDKDILRLIPLQNALMVLKEDGVYRVVGDGPGSFRLEPVDVTVRLTAPESAVAMNNRIYCLTELGVTEITEQGAVVISERIDDMFPPIRDLVRDRAYGIAYQNDRKYLLALPTVGGLGLTDIVLSYDFFTDAWTSHDIRSEHGIYDPVQDRWLVLANGNLCTERKSRTDTDFVDTLRPATASLSTFSGTLLWLSGTGGTAPLMGGGSASIAPGDVLYQNLTSSLALVLATGTSGLADQMAFPLGGPTAVLLDRSVSFSSGSAVNIGKSIPSTFVWTPRIGGNPGGLHHFQEAQLIFDRAGFYAATASFASDDFGSGAGPSTVGLTGSDYGLSPTGSLTATRVRVGVPRNRSRCSELSVGFEQRQALSPFVVKGLSVTVNPAGDKGGKR